MLGLNLFTVAMLCLFVASILFSVLWLRPRKQELVEEYGDWAINPVSVQTVLNTPIEKISNLSKLSQSSLTHFSTPSAGLLNGPSFSDIEPHEGIQNLSIQEAGSTAQLPTEVRHFVWFSRLTIATMIVSGALFLFCLPLINA